MLNTKRFLFAVIAVLLPWYAAVAQIYDPVDWAYDVKILGDDEAELRFTAVMEGDWHIYATDLPKDEGPVPTAFDFEKSGDYRLVGELNAGEYITKYDPNFMMDLNFYEGKAVFTQKIKRLSTSDFSVEGELTYMVCNDEMCLPPEYLPFALEVTGAQAPPQSPGGGSSGAGGMIQGGSVSMGMQAEGDASGILTPIKWTFEVEDENDTSAVLVATADLDEGWHLYSQHLESDMGPIATEFVFTPSEAYSLVGETVEGEAEVVYDPNFDMDLGMFSGTPRFRQTVVKHSDIPFKVSGYVTFMVCDDKQCLPPEDLDFSFSLDAGSGTPVVTSDPQKPTTGTSEVDRGKIEETAKKDESRSNWVIFIISFLSGFAALLTPCVFPMIPMTVSFFTKQSKSKAEGVKNAVIYGLSIIIIYVVLGVGVTAAFGASILSEMSTDPWFNLAFFALLIVFAISFLGAFEITLPSSWINKADARADRGGLIGIFFMAFTLALVSFSCTGPIVGTLIVEAASKGGSAPAIGMLGFSLAIALPFGLFAAFPGWLNTLPKSGGWLNSVKVVLGFLELALAFKFLSNADLVLQLHLLEREMFIAIWIVIFGLLTMYLLGKLKLPNDSDLKYIPVSRLLLATVTGVFTVYMIPGLWGAPLKIIAAFPPPQQYSESPMGVGYFGGGGGSVSTAEHDPDMHLGPQGIYVFHDYEKGLAHAKKVGKPLLVDFTGHACVNCRKMEQQVWSDPEIKRKLSEEVVLISLYVDERIELPPSEQVTVELTGGREKKLRTVGNKWAAFQELRFGVNAQPFYVILDHDEEMLVEPSNFQDYGTIKLFDDWLSRGLREFEEGGS